MGPVNTGDIPFKVTEGLHTYFSVSDVDAAVLRGLDGCRNDICLAARGHRKLILWSIPDSLCADQFSGDDWKHFVCLEPATIGREAAVTVLPGKCHELLMSVKAVKLK